MFTERSYRERTAVNSGAGSCLSGMMEEEGKPLVTLEGAVPPVITAKKQRDRWYPLRLALLLLMWPPLLIVGGVLTALMREDECSDI